MVYFLIGTRGCRKRLVSRKDVFVTIHRQKLENAAPILNHYFSKIHDISPLKAKPAIQKNHTSLQTYLLTAGNPPLATIERPHVYIELECPRFNPPSGATLRPLKVAFGPAARLERGSECRHTVLSAGGSPGRHHGARQTDDHHG